MILNEQINRMRKMMGLQESRRTEEDALRILSGVDNAVGIVDQFKQGDESKDQKNLGIMAFLYKTFNYTDIKQIVVDVNDYQKLLDDNRVKPIQVSGNVIKIGDKQFTNYLSFAQYIHGEKNKYGQISGHNYNLEDIKSNMKPMWSGNGIDIYEGDGVGKCIAYTIGGLTGRGYSFCIGQPGNTMYQSYRDDKTSSFYFIVDRNRFVTNDDGSVNLDDPLHIVVFDNTQYGIELTDANNTTGTIAEYGDDVDEYVDYLRSMGVPIDKLINKPKTDQEREEHAKLGQQNTDLQWFMDLSADEKSKYIGRGHQLTNDQFDYLIA